MQGVLFKIPFCLESLCFKERDIDTILPFTPNFRQINPTEKETIFQFFLPKNHFLYIM